MIDYAKADYYTDRALVPDPHAYFAWLREQGPVTPLPHRGVVAVTGYDEALKVMLDTEHFSTVNSVGGPFPPLPFVPEGDDITAQVLENRPKIPFSDMIVTQDGERHAQLRSLLSRLFTPSRLKALEPAIRATADGLMDEFAPTGRVNLVTQYGSPFATLVIADLLGLPEQSRVFFRKVLQNIIPAEMGYEGKDDPSQAPFVEVGKHLFGQIARRRLLHHPLVAPIGRFFAGGPGREDIMAELATARFPDGSKPSLVDVTGLAAFLFGAGQDTTNRLLANCLKLIATMPELQQRLRDEPARIPDFIEEVLRHEGSVKAGGRLCIKTVTLGGVEIKAGTVIMLSYMAANRDPARFADPAAFDIDRPKLKEHLGFGRGAHTCIGAPLARREVTVSIERLLARLANIRIDADHHGTEGAWRFDYEPTYILRALKALQLRFDPV
jgi:cytochrome P450